jgi:hypothetical protein
MVESSLPVNYAAAEHPSEVESRLRRLEASVAALQDTQLMEERVAERVAVRMKRSPMKSLRDSAGVIVDAGKMLLPLKSDASGSMARPVEAVADTMPIPPAPDKPGWLLFDLWSEMRTLGKMLFDHRYPFSYAGRFGPVIIGCTYAFSWLFVSGMPMIGGITERIIDVLLAFLLYKILAREVQRYRAMFPA